jgi:hypothetical protein
LGASSPYAATLHWGRVTRWPRQINGLGMINEGYVRRGEKEKE